ncbi:MAG: LemA protein [Methanolobus sp.]|jgi:LemA protein|nr:LemA protein [Methanolobus sp.]MDK2834928.1 LemA protein [Methanolobus sp.]MDK2911591.1 LemA protein [Methanolobus sp.]MDN5309874.1 LemA protein [Methanolobus sp.]
MVLEILIVVAVVAIGIVFVAVYNNLVKLRNRVENAWAQIEVQLKRRNDLIPNLVETVRGYAQHERSVFENVTKARAAVMEAKGANEAADASNMLTSTLRSLFAVAEAYPQLQANQNFIQLQKDLTDTEDRITYSRQFYNDTVMNYNTTIQSVPTNIVAGITGFHKRELFQIPPEEYKVPSVRF